MQKVLIFGPPGTGKTTYLMQLLENTLRSVSPSNIAFVSFTRKGTYEGVERAKEKFRFSDEDLPHFKTIHSLCFHALGLTRGDIISKKHYRLLSNVTGIGFTGYYTEDFSSTNDIYLHAASMQLHNTKLANKIARELNAKRFEYIKFQYASMKKQLGILDFDDILVRYLHKGAPLNVKVAFIDEAQDLTPLQWLVVEKMFSNAETVYVAGDDDQAVYEWSGADIAQFLNFSDNSVVLNKSYRMPETILKASKKITKDIAQRKLKAFKANGSQGEISSASSLSKLSLNGGELVLARTNWLLKQLAAEALENGWNILFKGKPSIDALTLRAIQAYIDKSEKLSKYASVFETIATDAPWTDVIKIKPHEIAYYERLIEYDAHKREPVLCETFHRCKGSENSHVVLSYELSKQVNDNYHSNRDAELRCLYVGMTRSKSKLTILSAASKEHYPDKYFQ